MSDRPVTFVDETHPLGPPASPSDPTLSAANLNLIQDSMAVLAPATSTRNVIAPATGVDSLKLLSSTSITNANVLTYSIPSGSQAFRVDDTGRIHGGPNRLLHASDSIGSTMHNSILDFLYDSATMRFYSRSAIFGETGDSPEIQLRRAGPDNQYPYPTSPAGTLTGITNGVTLGQITWYPFVTPTGGTPGTTRGYIDSPAGGIYMQAAQTPFEGKVGGRMYFSTTPVNAGNYVTALVIDSNQHIYNGSGSDIGRFSITGKVGDEASKVCVIRGADSQSANIFEVQYGSSHNTALKVDPSNKVWVAALGVGNSASATTLGSVQRKMEVFDSSNNSLGFVPIYSSIT